MGMAGSWAEGRPGKYMVAPPGWLAASGQVEVAFHVHGHVFTQGTGQISFWFGT